MVVRSSYLHNGILYGGKMTSLYWIRALAITVLSEKLSHVWLSCNEQDCLRNLESNWCHQHVLFLYWFCTSFQSLGWFVSARAATFPAATFHKFLWVTDNVKLHVNSVIGINNFPCNKDYPSEAWWGISTRYLHPLYSTTLTQHGLLISTPKECDDLLIHPIPSLLKTHGARVSAAVVLTKFSYCILGLAQYSFKYSKIWSFSVVLFIESEIPSTSRKAITETMDNSSL